MQNRIPQLDGVRGVAILLVLFVNTSEKYPALHLQRVFADGWMGVDLFFVLSGFLITRILLGSKASGHYFRNFYVRRALRILPLYYAVLLFLFVLVPWLRPSEAQVIFARSSPWWSYPLFLQNFLVAIPTQAPGPLGASWSLAIEEQFYLLWPLVVLSCSIPQLRRIALTMIIIAAPLAFYLGSHHVLIYSNVFCRQVGLMAGALLALLLASRASEPARYVKLAWLSLVVTLTLAILSEAYGARWLAFTAVALAAASFIFLALYSAQRWLQAVLRNRFLMYTGTISYGLYLLHKIVDDLAQSLHLDRHPALLLPVVFAGSYAAATVSWNLLEKPFLRLSKSYAAGPSVRPAR
ncbi:MAG: acyltransferase [Candidatus Acidiferrum sp.]|jgi:peptidoglycan/LPS O-acetylase OafA/YrhL